MGGISQEAPLLPEGELIDTYRDKIDTWREKYCFHTDDKGEDVAAPEYFIDLTYVTDSLKKWLSKQEKKNETARNSVARRYGEMAFHCAIVLHMLWGEPEEGNANREKVIKLTLYLADYLIERFLKKFADELNESIQKNRIAESIQSTPSSNPKPVYTDEFCASLIMQQKSGKAWKVIAEELHTKEDAVKSHVNRYKKRFEEKRLEGK